MTWCVLYLFKLLVINDCHSRPEGATLLLFLCALYPHFLFNFMLCFKLRTNEHKLQIWKWSGLYFEIREKKSMSTICYMCLIRHLSSFHMYAQWNRQNHWNFVRWDNNDVKSSLSKTQNLHWIYAYFSKQQTVQKF